MVEEETREKAANGTTKKSEAERVRVKVQADDDPASRVVQARRQFISWAESGEAAALVGSSRPTSETTRAVGYLAERLARGRRGDLAEAGPSRVRRS